MYFKFRNFLVVTYRDPLRLLLFLQIFIGLNIFSYLQIVNRNYLSNDVTKLTS